MTTTKLLEKLCV